MRRILFSVTALVSLAACAHHSPLYRPEEEWNARVNQYTVDQAISEFGPPAEQTPLPAGGTVCQWHHQGKASTHTSTNEYSSRTTATQHHDTLILTFDTRNVLTHWVYNKE